MTDHPLSLTGPKVRAALDGRMTQHRVVLKPQPPARTASIEKSEFAEWSAGEWDLWLDGERHNTIELPYAPGDRLWVREEHREVASGQVKNGYGEVRYGIAYHADRFVHWNDRVTKIHDLTGQPERGPMQFDLLPWRPPIFMRRRWSRLTLTVTDVRVERVQEISEADAIAEGAQPAEASFIDGGPMVPTAQPHITATPQAWYRDLWDALNAKRGFGWDKNPWVCALTFEVEQRNIDA